jgi:hypothetical protein
MDRGAGGAMSVHTDRKLESWEAVVPGIVFGPLAAWLAGGGWSERGLAAAANLAPLVVLALLAWRAGSRPAAAQGAATIAYGALALGWIGATWEWSPLALLAAHVELWTPVVAAGVALIVFACVWWVVGPGPRDPVVSQEE